VHEKCVLIFIGRIRRMDFKKIKVSFETEKSLPVLEVEPWFCSTPFY